MSDANSLDPLANKDTTSAPDEAHDNPNDDIGNRLRPNPDDEANAIDDDIGNRLQPEVEQAHIDDNIGNRQHGARPRPHREQPNGEGGRRRRGRRRRGEGRGENHPEGRRSGGGRERRPPARRERETTLTEYVLKSDPEDKRSKAEEVCTEIVRLCQREAEVKAELVEENEQPKVVVRIDEKGPDGFLFTRNSAALSALNFLINKIVNRFPDDRIRLVVHVNAPGGPRSLDKLSDEDLAVQKMATEIADRALQMQRAISIAPMKSELRRIVHVTLEKRSDVVTMSEGEGAFRKLLVVPRGMAPQTEPGRSEGDTSATKDEASTPPESAAASDAEDSSEAS